MPNISLHPKIREATQEALLDYFFDPNLSFEECLVNAETAMQKIKSGEYVFVLTENTPLKYEIWTKEEYQESLKE